MDEERTELDLNLDLNDDPFNPKKDKSKIIKGILFGIGALIVIAWYIMVTT